MSWIEKTLADPRFYHVLARIDADLAAAVRQAGCGLCSGVLHSARYPRKPRGTRLNLSGVADWRESFCCAGCRKRATPPSVRFLGRRVFLGAAVVLAAAMQQGPTPWRVRRLSELFDVSLQTLRRWQTWWQEAFADSDFWKAARASFIPPVNESAAPSTLLERFRGDERQRLVALLRFITPLTTSFGYVPDRRQ